MKLVFCCSLKVPIKLLSNVYIKCVRMFWPDAYVNKQAIFVKAAHNRRTVDIKTLGGRLEIPMAVYYGRPFSLTRHYWTINPFLYSRYATDAPTKRSFISSAFIIRERCL